MLQKYLTDQSKALLKVSKVSAKPKCHFPENRMSAKTKTVLTYYFLSIQFGRYNKKKIEDETNFIKKILFSAGITETFCCSIA